MDDSSTPRPRSYRVLLTGRPDELVVSASASDGVWHLEARWSEGSVKREGEGLDEAVAAVVKALPDEVRPELCLLCRYGYPDLWSADDGSAGLSCFRDAKDYALEIEHRGRRASRAALGHFNRRRVGPFDHCGEFARRP